MEDVFGILAVGFSLTLIFSVVLGFVAFFRWLRYKETVELARQGLIRPPSRSRVGKASTPGVIITAIGLALTCGLSTIGLQPWNELLGPWLLGGLIPLFIGIGLLLLGYMNGQERVSAEIDDDPVPPHKMP